eukprot:TRINITY_DN10206_c0_g1_i1.p1 TRINITY_DN10206_c0_g1~~TRINITY_DN10206_c0_g1_i1.p1  ORF type:complete len:1610 (+),score=418.38 TRINITY_DN10206_c0_g1_i1:716-4831(+)
MRERALRDCNALVRAAAVRALLEQAAGSRERREFEPCDLEVVVRASLDLSPRVRRTLFASLETWGSCQGAQQAAAWRLAVLRGLGDQRQSVRTAAGRCVLAAAQASSEGSCWWGGLLLAEHDLASGAIGNITAGIAQLVRQPLIQEASGLAQIAEHILRPMDPAVALVNVGMGSNEDRKVSSLFARLAVATMADLREPVSAGALVPLLFKALDALREESVADGACFELCQLLAACLVADLPADSYGRQTVAHAAAAVLKAAPAEVMAAQLLRCGAFPSSRLGAESELQLPALELALLLLRRVAADGAASSGGAKAAATAEAWFSRLAGAVSESLNQELRGAERKVSICQEEADHLRNDLDDRHWAEEASTRFHQPLPANGGSCRELEEALARKEAEIESAQEVRERCCLRAVLVSTTWLKYCRFPLAKDNVQSKLLESVLRPVVKDSEMPLATQVAALHGIAIYASKSKEHTVSHWDFFLGLLEAQLARLDEASKPSTTSPEAAAAPLCAALRMAEVAALFLCDALVLHHSALQPKATLAAEVAMAKLVARLDSAPNFLSHAGIGHLRAVLCDRACFLAALGRLGAAGGPAGSWLLGRLFGEVCGAFAESGKQAENYKDSRQKSRCSISAGKRDVYISLGRAPQASTADERSVSVACNGLADDDVACLKTKVASAVASARLLRFFARLPMLSEAHAEMFLQAVQAFFGARMYVSSAGASPAQGKRDVADQHHSRSRATPAVRAARLACMRLGLAKQALAAQGCDAVALQLRVVKIVAAALLAAPPAQANILEDALGAAVLAAAGGGPALDWAGDEAPALRQSLRFLLRDWFPSTTAKSVSALLREIHAPGRPQHLDEGPGRAWVQEAMDAAADFRHDLAALGCASVSGLGLMSDQGRTMPNLRTGYWRQPPLPQKVKQKPPAVVAAQSKQDDDESCGEADVGIGEEEEESEVQVSSGWEVVHGKNGEQAAYVPRGSGITIGRHKDCDVVLAHDAVSSRHCVIAWSGSGGSGGGVVLRDLSSANGTCVNGIRVSAGEELGLSHADVIMLARQEDLFLVLRRCEVLRSPSHKQEGAQKPEAESKAGPQKRKAENEAQKPEAGLKAGPQKQKVEDEVQKPEAGAKVGPQKRKAEEEPQEIESETKANAEGEEAEEEKEAVEAEAEAVLAGCSPLHGKRSARPVRRRLRCKTTDPNWIPQAARPPPPTVMPVTEVEQAARPPPSVMPVTEVEQVALSVMAAAKDSKVSHLSRLVDLSSGQVYTLPACGLLSIGRRADCEVVIPQTVVSGRHCVLLSSDGIVQLEDVSSNGTYLNDAQVPKGFSLPQRVPLHDGDHISLSHRCGPRLLFLAGQGGCQEEGEEEDDGSLETLASAGA